MTTVYVQVRPYVGSHGSIRPDYHGGAYIELTFAGRTPTEVINVWDYAASRSTCEDTPDAVEARVREWIASNESEGWTTWHADYIRNAQN